MKRIFLRSQPPHRHSSVMRDAPLLSSALLLPIVLLFLLLLPRLIDLSAQAASDKGSDITASCTVEGGSSEWLDDSETTYASAAADQPIVLRANEAIGGLYLRFDKLPTADYTIASNGKAVTVSPDFLHKYLDVTSLLGENVTELTLTFHAKTAIADLFILSVGAPPDFVQTWDPPCEQADLLLAPTHADDDHLFFLGVLPYYAGELQYEVQVIYFTNHNSVHDRPHELLNGLWTVGVRNYPVIAEMKDAWDGASKTLSYGYQLFESQGYSKKQLVDFWVEIIRRFTPQVIVGHDVAGEYGHPQHMVNTDALREALKVCGDGSYTLSGQDTAPYEPEKVYLHLWEENTITMDWDKPLSAFNGMTAYEVSKLGYACHRSQQWTWFTGWIKGSSGQYVKSTEIRTYSPNKYGLYFTKVGLDTVGGDFFENITPRSQIPPETTPPETLPPETTAPIVTGAESTDAPPSDSTPSATVPDSDAPLTTDQPSTDPADREPADPSRNDTLRWIMLVCFAVLLLLAAIILARYLLCQRSTRGRKRNRRKPRRK